MPRRVLIALGVAAGTVLGAGLGVAVAVLEARSINNTRPRPRRRRLDPRINTHPALSAGRGL